MTFPNVADISSAQGSFDAVSYAAGGRLAIIIKATEFLHYVNPFYVEWRDQAHKYGLITGEYHYMGDSQHDILGSPVDEAHHCLSVVGEHTPGRFLVCDLESATKIGSRYLYGMSAQQAADWGTKFLEVCTDEGGWPDLAYSMVGSDVIQRLDPRYPRWYAAYPGPVPTDRALHQFSSSSPVPGVGHCDDSYCFIDLKAYSQGSAPQHKDLIPEEEPVATTEFKRRMKDDGVTPDTYTDGSGKVYPFVYDGFSRFVEGEKPNSDIRVSVCIKAGPSNPSHNGQKVTIWSGTAGVIASDVNLSAFYSRIDVKGAGRQSIVSEVPIDAWVDTAILPA